MMHATFALVLAALIVPFAAAPATAVVDPLVVHPVQFFFVPAVLVVPVGTTVVFDNSLPGAINHTFTTADDLLAAFADQPNDAADTDCSINGQPGEDGNPDTCSVPLTRGTSFSHTFNNGGVITYYCQIHTLQKMVGVLVVV